MHIAEFVGVWIFCSFPRVVEKVQERLSSTYGCTALTYPWECAMRTARDSKIGWSSIENSSIIRISMRMSSATFCRLPLAKSNLPRRTLDFLEHLTMHLKHTRVRRAFVFVIQVEKGMDSLSTNFGAVYFHIRSGYPRRGSGFHVLLVDLVRPHCVRAIAFLNFDWGAEGRTMHHKYAVESKKDLPVPTEAWTTRREGLPSPETRSVMNLYTHH